MECNRRTEAKTIRGRVKELLLRRRFHEAVKLLSEAMKYFPRSYKFHRLRALAYSCLREYQLALQDAEMIIKIRPDCPEGYYQKGFCLYHQKAYLAAGAAFSEGLKWTPVDRIMLQAFWDAITLASQNRTCNATSSEIS
eukprot:g3081.t1